MERLIINVEMKAARAKKRASEREAHKKEYEIFNKTNASCRMYHNV